MDKQTVLEGSKRDYARWLREGHAIDSADIAGFAFRGISLGLPRLVERLTWKTFQKVFWSDDPGKVRGWNVRLEQRGVSSPSVPQTKGGRPITFGHFAVQPMAGYRVPGGTARRGLMLDYGGYHRGLHPMSRLRDPLVALNANSVELLLGWSYVALGARGVGTPSYFLLERESSVGEAPSPPKATR